MDDRPPPTPEQRRQAEATIERWLARELAGEGVVEAVERDAQVDRWYVRLRGEEKDVFSVWFELHQRTLRYETYVLPAPVVDPVGLYEYLLRRNLDQHGAAFAIGAEDAVFLVGRLPLEHLTEAALDEALGAVWSATERSFRHAVRLAFGSDPRRPSA